MHLKRGRAANAKAPPSNPNASPEARTLYARLLTQFGSRAGSARPMFIGTNETAGAVPYYRRSGLKFVELCGKQPLVKTFWPVLQPGHAAYGDFISAVQEHHRAGGICATIWHPKNYITGGDNYDRPRDDWEPVLQCQVGGAQNAAYRADQALMANLLALCVDDNGKRIAFFVRYGNETNGWSDYPDMTVDSLTRTGTTATMHFTRGANPIASQWTNPAGKFQMRGASDPKWNTLFNLQPGTYVPDGNGNGATVTFQVTTSPASNPTGTITCNPLAGDWWAGLDRAPDVLLLWRQTIEYFRDVLGCNQLIHAANIYTYNRLAASMNPATYPHSNWLTGMESYWDVVTSNLYQDEANWIDGNGKTRVDYGHADVAGSFQEMADWCTQNGRPVLFSEFGARYAGRDFDYAWSERMMGAFDAKYPLLAGAKTWTPDVFLPIVGTPAAADFARAMGNPRYVWRPQ